MRTLIVLILAVCLGAGAGAAAGPAARAGAVEEPAARPSLASIHRVYLMPMSGGLDQYLAEQLTTQGPFTVVVDPKLADAVWSEGVDPAFTAMLEELYPAAKPPKPKKDGDAEMKQIQPPRRSLGSGHGNVFLVSVHSRQVIWSTYLNPNDRMPKTLHRAAANIVKQLKKELGGQE